MHVLQFNNDSNSAVCVYDDEALISCVPPHTRLDLRGATDNHSTVWIKDEQGHVLWKFEPTESEQQRATNHGRKYVGYWNGRAFRLAL